jgi:hypothetical protein
MADEYDVFISYRRERGSDLAVLLAQDLRSRGCRVFLDTTSMPGGEFPKSIEAAMKSAHSCIVILTPKCFSLRSPDWFLEEIALARRLSKNIVPIRTPGFSDRHLWFVTRTAVVILAERILQYEIVEYSPAYRDAAFQKVARLLRSGKRTARKLVKLRVISQARRSEPVDVLLDGAPVSLDSAPGGLFTIETETTPGKHELLLLQDNAALDRAAELLPGPLLNWGRSLLRQNEPLSVDFDRPGSWEVELMSEGLGWVVKRTTRVE